MPYEIDFSDMTQFKTGIRRIGTGRVVQEARPSFQRMGETVRTNARQHVGRKSGRLASTATVKTTAGGSQIVTEVRFSATSPTGFDYAGVHHDGRGPVVARGKALRFTVGGQVLYRKRVGPAKGTKYLDKGVQQSLPAIAAEARRLEQRIAMLVEQA